MLIRILLAFLFGVTAVEAADWHQPGQMRVDMSVPEEGYYSSWTFRRCDCGDLNIHVEQSDPNQLYSGDLLLVGGEALLSQGFGESPDPGIMDAPVLMLQLTFALLQAGAATGPDSIGSQQSVSVTEEILSITLDSGLSSGVFAAPWTVTGQIWPGNEQRLRYDLSFSFSPGQGQTQVMRLSGWWDGEYPEWPYIPDYALEGWSISWLDEDREAIATPATIGELKAYLAQ